MESKSFLGIVLDSALSHPLVVRTTIIEALKFAVTGSLPPGNNSGQAFVHDPRSIGHTKVKANVKLRFTNRSGNDMVVIRSMEVTQAPKKLQFKHGQIFL